MNKTNENKLIIKDDKIKNNSKQSLFQKLREINLNNNIGKNY